jgi:hypothetical protein
MALSGSQKAYRQARSGIARSGATRSNYYRGDAVITIDDGSGPVDISRHIVHNGWSVSLNLNDEVDTASIALLPSCPFMPKTRSQINIGLGGINNLLFAGIILTVQATRRPGPDPRLWYDLTCIDWTALLDAHLVLADYPTQSATTTIVDIVSRFARVANLSTAGVPANLPDVAGFSAVHERPSEVLRRVTNKIGGGFYLDPHRILHAWSNALPSPIQPSPPQPLTDTLPTLKTFQLTTDASQQRTRVWAEGQSTRTLLGVPGTAIAQQVEVPLAEGGVFDGKQGADYYARIGTQYGTGPLNARSPVLDAAQNPPGTKLSADAAIGATTLAVVDAAAFPTAGWCQVASQVLPFTKTSATALALRALPGYSGLQAPASTGDQVILIPWITHDAVDRPAAPPFLVSWPGRVQPEGAPAVLVVVREDAAVAAVLAAREGSDGFYEHLVQDGRYNRDGARARALAELADFSQPTVTYAWETDDLNAAPGLMQTIALSAGTPVSATVRITNVTITPIATNQPPRRQVTAAAVRPAGVLDVWAQELR